VCILRVLNLCEHRTNAVFDQKFIVGWSYYKIVLDASGFRAYCVDVNWGFDFLSVIFVI